MRHEEGRSIKENDSQLYCIVLYCIVIVLYCIVLNLY